MDIRILRSLATSAMYPYFEGKGSAAQIHDGKGDANGAQFPDEVAIELLGVRIPWAAPFWVGFDLALAIASAITNGPTRSPDLSEAIRNAKLLLGMTRPDGREVA